MVRRAFVVSLAVAVAACAVDGLSSPDLRPSDGVETEGKPAKAAPVKVGGLEFGQFPAPAGELSAIAFATDGSFTGTFVVSCVDAGCLEPRVATIGGSYRQPGSGHDVDLHVTSIAVPRGTPFACQALADIARRGRVDGEIDEGSAGGVLTLASSNLCTGRSYVLAESAAETVGTAGGTVTAPSGASVTLPPGALAGNTTITVTPSPGALAAPGTKAVSTPVVFGPEGAQFSSPVTVTLPIDPSLLPAGTTIADALVYTAPAGTTSFKLLPTTVVDATHVSAETTHFSLFVVSVPTTADGGVDCNALLSNILGQPLQPPYRVAGIDFANDDAGTPSTIDELEQEAPGCITYVDQQFFDDGGTLLQRIAGDPNFNPGYRRAVLGQQIADGGVDPNALQVYYNMQPPSDGGVGGNLYEWSVGTDYTGQLQFSSRAGGRYASPAHSYVISVPSGVERCDPGYVNCAAWPPSAQASYADWADEIYDGMMATFSPATPDLGSNCASTVTSLPLAFGQHAVACLALQNDGTGLAYVGVRPLRFYIELADAPMSNLGSPTASVLGFYGFITAGYAGCSTPLANQELRDYGHLAFPYGNPSFLNGVGQLANGISNPNGLTLSEIQSTFACGAPSAPPAAAPIDPGYGAGSWGPEGEITLEYNTADGGTNQNVGYKIIATAGFFGTTTVTDNGSAADGGNDSYTLGVGTLAKDGTPYPIDWSNPSQANGIITELVNAFYYNAPIDTDCTSGSTTGTGVADCVIVPDGSGNVTVTIPGANFGVEDEVLVFAAGAPYPTAIEAVNPGGQ